ncbi:hypothetical protein [Allohahella sp. A8]|uniref:hypothetical protein n=1 Tax=Allohahella sp. A8 TaxID=3141461 RepID=UPI003A80BA78
MREFKKMGLFDRKKKTEEDAFAASPVGLARAAKSSGRSILQIIVPIRTADAKRGLTGGVFFTDSEDGSLLEAIENEGWALEHVSHVFQLNGSIKDTGFREGSERYAGEIVGVYIFRAGAPSLDKAGAGGLSK